MNERKQHITLQLDAHHISLNVPADKEGVLAERVQFKSILGLGVGYSF